MTYTVFFIVGGKKLKKKITADNKVQAVLKLRESIEVVKIVDDPVNDFFQQMMDILNKK